MKNNNNDLKKEEFFYESIAADFDNVMNRYEVAKRLDIIFNKILNFDLKGKKFLDAGCGTGLFSAAAAKRGAIVTSLDVGSKLLEQVAKKCKSKRIIGNVAKMPFKDNSFDIVLATEIIEHTSNPEKSIGELSRVTKPGGLVIITVPNKIWKLSIYIANIFKIRPYHAFENWLWWWELRNFVTKNNMNIESNFGFNIIPFFHPLLQPIITFFDPLGKLVSPLMVNIAIVARKNVKK